MKSLAIVESSNEVQAALLHAEVARDRLESANDHANVLQLSPCTVTSTLMRLKDRLYQVSWMLRAVATGALVCRSSCSSDLQAENTLKINSKVIKDSVLANYREPLLAMSLLEPGLIIEQLSDGHAASALVKIAPNMLLVQQPTM